MHRVRLLTLQASVGMLLGKRGATVTQLRLETGAGIKVLPMDPLPPAYGGGGGGMMVSDESGSEYDGAGGGGGFMSPAAGGRGSLPCVGSEPACCCYRARHAHTLTASHRTLTR